MNMSSFCVAKFYLKNTVFDENVPQFVGCYNNPIVKKQTKEMIKFVFNIKSKDITFISYDEYLDECVKYGITPSPNFIEDMYHVN